MSGRAHGGHRPGPLKQQNKAHKHGRHKSKGQQSDSSRGRVGMKVLSRQARRQQSKADKRNKMKQLRNNKRHEVLEAKRGRGGEGVPPHLIVIIPLDPSLQLPHIFKLLTTACGCEDGLPYSPTCTVVFPVSKQRFSLVFPPSTGDLYTTLDLAKVADSLLFVYPASITELAPFSQLLLDCCSLQGLPTTTHAVMGLSQHLGKTLSKAKKAIQSLITKRFPTSRLHHFDSGQDASNLLRYIGNQKRHPVHCRDSHAHLVAERVRYDKKQQTLQVTGYLRSRPLSVNGLLHIPGVGDFQMKQIDAATDLCPLKPSHSGGAASLMEDSEDGEGMDEDIKVLEVADPTKQESLVGEVVPDPMEGEQTWPTEEELKAAKKELKARQSVHQEKRRVPVGTSEYQAAWIIEDSEGEESGSEDEEGVEFDEVGGAIQPVEDDSSSTEGDGESITASEMDTDTMTLPDADKYDVHFDLESEQQQLALLRAEREDKMFPDEVDTPIDTLAKIRFQKYRGLKSFRHSDWDPKENLPRDYARIYQFDNFDRTRRRVLAIGSGKRKRDEGNNEEGALAGWYITLHIDKVSPSVAERCQGSHAPLVVYGLLPHENKMSVVHYAVRRTPNFTEPIKSKDHLIFQCGVRWFTAGPIFSQHTTGNKHKFEKFLHPDTTTIASVFAPVSYPPQPVLVFKAMADDSHVLVASGSLLSVKPNRVICKRIVLSGHPFKINKRSAVIRYMFFNREDIMWFKPVELRTKYGRRGHIKEPLGTHGHVKCVFDGHLKAQDTVLMNLYKRVFPKWTYAVTFPRPLAWTSAIDIGGQRDTETMQQ